MHIDISLGEMVALHGDETGRRVEDMGGTPKEHKTRVANDGRAPSAAGMVASRDVEAGRVCKILVPVDGSENSARAVRLVIRLHAKLAPLAVHLLHVQVPVLPIGDESANPQSTGVAAGAALTAAKALLDAAAVPYSSEIASGHVGSTIVSYARERGCDGIVMGTRGVGSTEQLLGSIARQVVQHAEMPVTLVK